MMIRLDNSIRERKNRTVRKQVVKEITQNKFWKFWGIILCARVHNRQGTKLWDRARAEGVRKPADMSEYMSETCNKQIKKYMSYLFADKTRKGVDP